METDAFQTVDGEPVTAVTAAEMREVDRVAVEEYGLGILQMMENAGRNLAWHARAVREGADERDRDTAAARPVTVLAGTGGNGGGGLCCARHLANRDVPVSVVLDRDPDALEGPARTQYETVAAMDVPVTVGPEALSESGEGAGPTVVVDALVGYGLSGPLRGTAGDLVEALADVDGSVLSLDVPSGVDATTGERPGPAVDPDRVVTLALPKTGLADLDASLVLADIAIPAGVYEAIEIPYAGPFDDEYWVALAT